MGKLGHVVQTGSCVCRKRVLNPVILLPCCILRPRKGRKMIHDVRPVGRKDRLIDLKMRFCGISCSCDFCGSYYDCCLTMRIYFF